MMMGKRIIKETLIVIFLMLSFSGCGFWNLIGWPWSRFDRNPNLIPVVAKDGYLVLNPVWGPNNKIYYLQSSVLPETDEIELRRINVDGSGDTFLIYGKIGHLCMSKDGEKLAIITGTFPEETYIAEGEDSVCHLIIIDLNGKIIDTIPTSQSKIFWYEFSWTDSFIYYYGYGDTNGGKKGYYRINLNTFQEEFLFESDLCRGFILTSTDSIIECFQSQVNPVRNNYVISCRGGHSEKGEGLFLHKLGTDEREDLDAVPYRYAFNRYPCWSPDGNDVVFSSAKAVGEPLRPGFYEIWILKNVFEQIKIGGEMKKISILICFFSLMGSVINFKLFKTPSC
uniref:Dipeptidylpeptidase IV N-terminal domain-containing protein n=1 Tax=candidate division WOR-3 bacterium TaxID=2052148 RepID=A0A7C4UAU1_UNCW3